MRILVVKISKIGETETDYCMYKAAPRLTGGETE